MEQIDRKLTKAPQSNYQLLQQVFYLWMCVCVLIPNSYYLIITWAAPGRGEVICFSLGCCCGEFRTLLSRWWPSGFTRLSWGFFLNESVKVNVISKVWCKEYQSYLITCSVVKQMFTLLLKFGSLYVKSINTQNFTFGSLFWGPGHFFLLSWTQQESRGGQQSYSVRRPTGTQPQGFKDGITALPE